MASNVAAETERAGTLAELDRLELVLRRLLEAAERWQHRAKQAETRTTELEGALDGVRTGTLDPMQLGERVQALEAENARLRERIEAADVLVQRIQARLQFFEEER